MIFTLNNRDVYSMRVRVPRLGAWHVTECEIAGDEPMVAPSPAVISMGGQVWTGTVVDSHSFTGSTTLRIVGGAGGLSKRVPAQHYLAPSPELVIRAILAAAGEELDSSSSIPATTLPHWVSSEGQASHALTAIADKAGLVWRILPTGKVWVGAETWPAVEPVGAEVLDEDWSDGSIVVAGEDFLELSRLAPGTTFLGHRLEQVEHRVDGIRVRTIPQISSLDTAAGEFLSAVRKETERALSYPCKVVSQNTDGTLQLVPEDPRMPSNGLAGVPIRYGAPGLSAKVTAGARVRFCFDNGDRSQPYATDWDSEPSKVSSISVLGGTRPFAKVGDMVMVTITPATVLNFSGLIGGAPATGVINALVPIILNGMITSGTPRFTG